jgi:ferritin-like metal-binding protein YciE
MSQSEQKIVQYLNEAHALESGLVQVLRSQIAMTPEGSYRSGLEKHLRETQAHADRVKARQGELASAANPFVAGVAFMEDVAAQTLALWKAPLDLMRGATVAEKVLENAKDACAAEALEIATYTALEHLARAAGDEPTAELAASIRAEEERMLERVTRELPKLARAVVGERADAAAETADVVAETADVAAETTDVARESADATERVIRGGDRKRSRPASRNRPAPATKRRAKKPAPTAEDLAIPGYDDLTAEEISGRLAGLSQSELAAVDAYEKGHGDRSTIRSRIETLRGDEPWQGYDELGVDEIRAALRENDDDQRAEAVRTYERAHKNRAGVLSAVERDTATA